MSSTSTTRLLLFKPVGGSGEPFRTSDLNSNSDKIDAEAVAVDARLDVVELATTSGTVQNAVLAATATLATSATLAARATDIAGGLQKQIPIQSGANSTVFIAAPASAGRQLSSTLSSPYAVWIDPIPYKIQTGTVVSGSGGVIDKTFTTAFDVAPIVTATVFSTSGKPETVVLNLVNTTKFTGLVYASSGSVSPFNDFVTATGRTVYFTAVQYSSSAAAS